MAVVFDIIEYLSGLTGFVFDKAVLNRIALDRGVENVKEYGELDAKTKDLLKADLLCSPYFSPNVWASHTHSHGSYSQNVGSQSINSEDKERIFNMFMSIYRKYDDAKLDDITDKSTLQWLI